MILKKGIYKLSYYKILKIRLFNLELTLLIVFEQNHRSQLILRSIESAMNSSRTMKNSVTNHFTEKRATTRAMV